LLYEAGHKHPPEAGELRASCAFVALQKTHLRWLVGGRPATLRTSRAMLEKKRLALLYGSYLPAGDLEIPSCQTTSPPPKPSRRYTRQACTF
jgi:hypothetical protein